jgi:Protein of unknown function (DUF1614)
VSIEVCETFVVKHSGEKSMSLGQLHYLPATPTLLPILVGIALALVMLIQLLAWRYAYTRIGLGTLIGADLLNLDKVQGLGAPMASIGGAGTFDGIFLTGVLAALIASISWRSNRVSAVSGLRVTGLR